MSFGLLFSYWSVLWISAINSVSSWCHISYKRSLNCFDKCSNYFTLNTLNVFFFKLNIIGYSCGGGGALTLLLRDSSLIEFIPSNILIRRRFKGKTDWFCVWKDVGDWRWSPQENFVDHTLFMWKRPFLALQLGKPSFRFNIAVF